MTTTQQSDGDQTTTALWLVALDTIDDADVRAYTHCMSSGERLRYERFKAPAARLHYAVARALLRTVLSRYAEVAPVDWRFEVNAYGKPRISSPGLARDLRFNLSHTDGLAALAVTDGRDIGVDVESGERRIEAMDLARTAFAPSEIAALERLPDERRPRRFLEIWTLKEAYAKARGLGVSLPFERFAFDLDGDGIGFTSMDDPDTSSWQFRLMRPSDIHVLALACRTRDLSVGVNWVEAETLRGDLDQL